MKTDESAKVHKVGDKYYLITEDKKMCVMNETTHYIFDQIKNGRTIDEIVNSMKKEYSEKPEKIRSDVEAVVMQMRTEGIVLE